MYNIQEFSLSKLSALIQRASNGWMLKWNLGDYWVKAPGYIFDYTWDSVAEVLASTIAEDLRLDKCLRYKLCIINMDGIRLIGCISRNYNKPKYNEITIDKLIKNNLLERKSYFGYEGYKRLIQEIKELFNVDITSYLEDMILIDSIILNNDRNFWNMSIMLDSNTYQGKLAPIYDFGNSLGLTGGRSGSFHEEVMYSTGLCAKPFSSEFEEQLTYIRNIREYNGELTKTRQMLKFLYNNFTTQNNIYRVVNSIDKNVLKYTCGVIDARYNTIIEDKYWKNNILDS